MRNDSVQITALLRNLLSEYGLDWSQCVEIGSRFRERVEWANYLETDTGFAFTRSFDPTTANSK